MNATEELALANQRSAASRFFLKAGRERGLRCGDEYTLPLFGLPLILEAEGLLTKVTPERGHGRDQLSASRNGGEGAAASSSPAPHAEYLKRCEQAIAAAARAWAA